MNNTTLKQFLAAHTGKQNTDINNLNKILKSIEKQGSQIDPLQMMINEQVATLAKNYP